MLQNLQITPECFEPQKEFLELIEQNKLQWLSSESLQTQGTIITSVQNAQRVWREKS
jgi:hypothetical protein